MRALVTGGAGFIGSHLCDALLVKGYQVTVVDDLSSGSAARLDERAAFLPGDITDGAFLKSVTRQLKPAVIFHLAAQVNVTRSVFCPATDADTNVVGTINVLEAARTAGARVIFASSGGALYGQGSAIPTTEDATPVPESPYGVAKFCAEQYVNLYNQLHAADHAILRFANVYGPRQDTAGEGGVISIFCRQALYGEPLTIFGDGRQTRDYIYVADAVSALLAAVDFRAPGIWHIGTGTEVTVRKVASIVSARSGNAAEISVCEPRLGEIERSAICPRKAAKDLGWRPLVPLESGIGAVYSWVAAGQPDREKVL